MSRKSGAITLTLNSHQKTKLEELAIEFDFMWGSNANISALIKAIAEGRITLYKPGSPINASDRGYYRQQLSDLEAAIANLKTLID